MHLVIRNLPKFTELSAKVPIHPREIWGARWGDDDGSGCPLFGFHWAWHKSSSSWMLELFSTVATGSANQSLFAKAWIIINHPRNKCFVESLRWRLHRMISNVYPSLYPVVQDLVHLRQSSLFEGHSVFMMFKCLEIPWTKISQPFFCTASTAFGHTGRFDSHKRCHLCRETSGERAHSSMGFLSKFSSKAILLVL